MLNILGNESRAVAPISHAYSRGNIVFGTSPGRRGEVLETPVGPIPVYNNVREGLDDGHNFNVGVIHLPPAAVRDGALELMRVNPHVQKIIILTEKVPVHDSREIRAMAQQRHVDLFGPNCLGVADAWNHVRIGGPLGGEKPEESFGKARSRSIPTPATSRPLSPVIWRPPAGARRPAYRAARTCISALRPPNSPTPSITTFAARRAVLYIEPGGYYEEQLEFSKPVIACVAGRWKAKLTRAVGHAGAMGGAGDSAAAKEEWFKRILSVDGIYHARTSDLSRSTARW